MRFTKIITALLAVIFLSGGVRSAAAQPELVLVSPQDGAALQAVPPIIHMCFAKPVNILDLDKGGDFQFSVKTPDGRGLGLRIVFQPDGLGVDIHPGYPTPPPEGEWTFEWRVTEPETLAPASGAIKFTVSAGGSAPPEAPAAPCGGTPFPDATSPASSDLEGDDDGLSTLTVVIIAAAATPGAALLALIALRARRRT